MKKAHTLVFLLLVAVIANAQDLTGIWRGHFRANNSFESFGGIDDRYKLEVQIAQKNSSFEAVTYSYLSTIFYGKASADGSINFSSKKVVLNELKLLEVRMTYGSQAIRMTYFLKYSKLGDEEFLEGTYISHNGKDSTSGDKGVVFLHKVQTSDFGKNPFLEKREKEIEREKHKSSTTTPPPPVNKNNSETKTPEKIKIDSKKPSAVSKNNVPKTNNTNKHIPPKPAPKAALAKTETPKKINTPTIIDTSHKIEKKNVPVLITPKVLTSRQNELVRTITVSTNEVELRIYDDGTIDHDTVSVYVDKRIVINHAMLTDQPIIVKLHMDDDNDYHEVVMVAENEGEIPPNTSLMVVKAGDKEYEVRIVSTEQKNATVIFKFEKGK